MAIIRKIVQELALHLKGTGISKSKLMYNILTKIKKKIKPKFVIIEDCKILLDENDTYGFTFFDKFSDEEEILEMKKIVKEGDVVVDVGANIGIYTCILAKLVGETGHVYSFEPIPENAQLVRESCKLNEFENVTIIEKGVSDEQSKSTMFLAKDSAGHSFSEFNGSIGTKEIEITTIDDEIKNKVKFMKVDAEGYELKVLKGMNKIFLNSNVFSMLIEFFPERIFAAGDSPKEFLSNLISKFSVIDLKTNERIVEKDIDNIIEKYKERPNHLTNFLCKKPAKNNKI